MRPRVLLHAAVLLDAVAALKILANRASAEHLKDGLISPQNLPLALVILVIVLLLELASKRFRKPRAYFLAFLGLIFFLCSLYIYPQNRFKDESSILGYGVLILQFSAAGVTVFFKSAGLGRILGVTVFVFVVLSIIGFAYTFSNAETYDGHSKVDAAVVLGASVWGKDKPSPLLRGRLNTAMKLFKSGIAKKIVVTGGTKRFGTIESEVEASYLRENGVKDSHIIRDRRSLSTPEQVDFVKNVLIDSLKMKKIVIVTDRWHLPRVLLMCRWQNARVKGMASDYRMFLPSDIYYRMRESAALQVYLLFGA
ncbi:MAG: YdcF family protein [Bacteroidetes bacterium]|nr:YdcF family protein [Bacteroidota bacterium]